MAAGVWWDEESLFVLSLGGYGRWHRQWLRQRKRTTKQTLNSNQTQQKREWSEPSQPLNQLKWKWIYSLEWKLIGQVGWWMERGTKPWTTARQAKAKYQIFFLHEEENWLICCGSSLLFLLLSLSLVGSANSLSFASGGSYGRWPSNAKRTISLISSNQFNCFSCLLSLLMREKKCCVDLLNKLIEWWRRERLKLSWLLEWKPITVYSAIKNLWFLWRRQQQQFTSISSPSTKQIK